ncbi:hypothetical protein ASPCAL04655 [Aspergillus calidoustus]|uniref:Uncharacterized protein n=1 Tax=Aspergillus calidoustus TaxID=454130 RepID=A0A0U5FXX1_ASPCI|nr:hypothetical protein ASPCAL04655 [Aspergillus calidoustus]
MTLVNMNPHITPQHHPSIRPGEGPRPAYNNPSGSSNPDRLADRLSQLHIHQDRLHEARPRGFDASAEVDEDTDLVYVGYTFFKAPPAPGHNANWTKVEKSRMNLGQNGLSALVKKKAKRKSVVDQYQGLRLIRRTHVDDLISELRENNPQYHWTCVYVKEEERNVRGKGYSRNSYETSSMDIILQGKALSPSGFRARPVDSRDAFQYRDIRDQRPLHTPQHSGDESRPFSRAAYPEPWRGSIPPHAHGPHQASVHFQQQGPSHQAPTHAQAQPQPQPQPYGHGAHQASVHFQQQGPPQAQQPPHVQPQPHVQVPPHAQSPPQHRAGEPKYPQQVNWAQNGPAGYTSHPHPHPQQQQQQQPIVHNHPNTGPAHSPRPGVQDQSPRGAARGGDSPNHQQEIPHHRVSSKQQAKGGKKRDKSPKHVVGSEPELVYDTTSSDDDNILTPGFDGEDWETEFSERDTASKPAPWRGSLYRGVAPSQRRHTHRQHYRKDPQRAGDHRAGRYYRDDSAVDIIPASSSRSSRRLGRTHSGYRGTARQHESQPKIMQEISAEDLDILMGQLRGHAHHAARGRMLNQWESELAEREEMLKYHQQMAARYEDNNYLGRSRSLRQPLTAYPHGYLQLR